MVAETTIQFPSCTGLMYLGQQRLVLEWDDFDKAPIHDFQRVEAFNFLDIELLW